MFCQALAINVGAVIAVIDLARKMPNLKVLAFFESFSMARPWSMSPPPTATPTSTGRVSGVQAKADTPGFLRR
jgi:hypothetical protein